MAPPQSMNQAQLNAALKDLETALTEGEAELKQKPDQFEMVKSLYAELKKMKPGATPSAKVVTLLQAFLAKQIDEEIRDETARLKEAQAVKGPVAVKVTEAHKSVLNALTQARHGLGALNPILPPEAIKDTGVRINNANQAAAAAVGNAEAALAFAPPKPAKK